MITFEELYTKMKDEMPYSCPMHMKPYVKQLAEIYAKYVATKALKDAAENIRIGIESPSGRYFSQQPPYCDPDGDTISIDKESITKTKIETP